MRERFDVTHGLRANCGSIDPDSRIGTSSDVIHAGTPVDWNSHVSTVFGATIWSPMFCRPFDQMKRFALRSSLIDEVSSLMQLTYAQLTDAASKPCLS